MDEAWAHYTEQNQPITDTLCFHLYEAPRVVKLTEVGGRMGAAQSWKAETMQSQCLKATVSVTQNEELQRWMVVMVAQHYECIKTTELYTQNLLRQ